MNCSSCGSGLPFSPKPNKSGLCKTCYRVNWRKLNVEKIAALGKRWYLANKEKRAEQHRVYRANRIKTDVGYKIQRKLRIRLYQALKGNFKTGSAVGALGCSIEDFKKHIESKFQPGMTWDNWSRDGWHIDHVVPLCVFDLTNPEQLNKACHYTNMQPMWSTENWRKGGKHE
jgi:hypothetical protein